MKKLLAAAATVFGVCSTALAQAPLGAVVDVQGVVTATQGTTGTTVASGSPIVNGMRFVTTGTGQVTLRLNNGCVVTLQPNQAVTVLQQMNCQQLVASITPVTPVAVTTITPATPGAAIPATSPFVVGGVIGLGALGLAAQIIRTEADDDDEPSVSPN